MDTNDHVTYLAVKFPHPALSQTAIGFALGKHEEKEKYLAFFSSVEQQTQLPLSLPPAHLERAYCFTSLLQ